MSTTSRPYAGDADRERMRELIVAAAGDAAWPNYWCVGDLLWGLYQNTLFDPFSNVRLWERADGALLGFAWFSPPSVLEWELDPRFGASEPLAEQILAWGAERRRALPADADGQRRLTASARDDDPAKVALLQIARIFRRWRRCR